MGSSTFHIHQVPEILRRDVECFILNRFNGPDRVTINVFPGGMPGIVFHHNDGHPAIENIALHSGRRFSPPTLFLHGVGTESSVMNFGPGTYTVVQVILKPHALRALFGVNALRLNDGSVEVNDFSSEKLSEQLMNARNDQERVKLIEKFLIANLEKREKRDNLVEESLRLIHHCAGLINVRTLLEYLDISERHFERKFSEAVGISPVSYIRVRRFNEALRLMKTGKYGTLTEIAYALNFHDQSHFIRDLKAFTRITPKGLSQKVEEFSHNQAGYSYT
jgi:AraC-like DNA-binding protein